jgi:hypothetical protein
VKQREAGSAGVATAALAAIGWLLLAVSAPVAVFLTWWGDCLEDTCAGASELDRAVYLFDLGAWLAIPALAFGAYRGWRPASAGLVAIGVAIVAQVVAAILGARGFQSFAFVLPAGAFLVAAGIVGLVPGGRDEARDASTARTGLIGLVVLSAVIVALVFQSFVAGGGGIGQGLLLLVGASLTFITILAVLNRGRKPPPQAPDRGRGRGR